MSACARASHVTPALSLAHETHLPILEASIRQLVSPTYLPTPNCNAQPVLECFDVWSKSES
jgi:hypothetical protein